MSGIDCISGVVCRRVVSFQAPPGRFSLRNYRESLQRGYWEIRSNIITQPAHFLQIFSTWWFSQMIQLCSRKPCTNLKHENLFLLLPRWSFPGLQMAMYTLGMQSAWCMHPHEQWSPPTCQLPRHTRPNSLLLVVTLPVPETSNPAQEMCSSSAGRGSHVSTATQCVSFLPLQHL